MRMCTVFPKPAWLVFGVLIATVSPAVADGWLPGPPLNEAREVFGAAVDECGNIWAVGGWNRTGGCSDPGGYLVDTIEKLQFDGDAYADEWTITPIVMPTLRQCHTVAIVNGFIYVIGGLDQIPFEPDAVVRQVDRYDMFTGTWSAPPELMLNTPRTNHGTTVDRFGRIWVIGGNDDSQTTVGTVEIFDPARPELGWQIGPELNEARARCGCVMDQKGRLYAIGGMDPNATPDPHLSTTEWIDPCGEGTWQIHEATLPPPSTADDQAVLGADGLIYVVGGWRAHWWEDRVVRLDPDEDAWDEWNPLGQLRNNHRVVLGHDGYIYAIGGDSLGCLSITGVEKLYTGPCLGDLYGVDRCVDVSDLAELLARYGTCCP